MHVMFNFAVLNLTAAKFAAGMAEAMLLCNRPAAKRTTTIQIIDRRAYAPACWQKQRSNATVLSRHCCHDDFNRTQACNLTSFRKSDVIDHR